MLPGLRGAGILSLRRPDGSRGETAESLESALRGAIFNGVRCGDRSVGRHEISGNIALGYLELHRGADIRDSAVVIHEVDALW